MRLPLVLAGALAALVAGALLALGLVVSEGTAPGRGEKPEAAEAAGATDSPPDVRRAVAALRTWDRGRARAWASGDPAALASLYAPGSVAGRRDVRMLRRWRARGLVVRGLRTELLSVEVTAEASQRLELLVTDRLVGGTAARADRSGRALALPADTATRRRVVLVPTGGRWRVSSVLPAG